MPIASLMHACITLNLSSSSTILQRMVKIRTFDEFKIEVKSTSENKEKRILVRNYVREQRDQGGFPVVEEENVTFVYLGKVRNKIFVAGDMNNYSLAADYMEKIDGTNLYYKRMKFPLDARIQYAYIKNGEMTLDPLNKKQCYGGLGPFSELQMPEYKPPNEIDYDPKAPHGKIQAFRFHSEIMDNNRIIHVYLPPGYNPSETYPVIYAQDGSDYLRFGFFDNVLDNLIKEELITKVLAVFIDPTDRLSEYDLNDNYTDFLLRELVPYIDARYSTIRNPSKRLVMGASFGGLISTYAAFKHPEVFGKAASQSGYLSRKNDRIIHELGKSSKKKIEFYLDCGTYETNVGLMFGNFIEGNRRMRKTLQKKGYKLVYQEFHEGHNWGNWRSRITSILENFFGLHGILN